MLPKADGWLHMMATDSAQWYTHQADVRSPIHYAPPLVYEINASYSAANVTKTNQAIAWYHTYRRKLDADGHSRRGQHLKYFSGRDCVDNNPRYARQAQITRSDLEGDIPGSIFTTAYSGDPNRFFIDISQSAVRDWMADFFVSHCVENDYTALVLDNITYQQSYGPVTGGEITLANYNQAFLDLLGAVHPACEAEGISLVINLAVGTTIAVAWPLFYSSVDGLAYEQPMHELVTLNNSADVAEEIDTYAEALAAGKTVLLFPQVEGVVTRPVKQRIVACAAMFAKRNAADPIFVWGVDTAGNGTPENFSWFTWPQDFGQPLSDYVRNGNVFSRKFQRGTLTLDLSTYTAPVITADLQEFTIRPNEGKVHEIRRELQRVNERLYAADPLNTRSRPPRTEIEQRRAFQNVKREVDTEYPTTERRGNLVRRALQKIKEAL